MVAYSFQKRFGPPILSGRKRHTIRAERAGRSRHARLGEAVQLYTGMRTKHCRLLGEPACTAVLPVRMNLRAGIVFANDGWIRLPIDLDLFAVADGFRDWDDLLAFWAEQHPGVTDFSGVMIQWKPLIPLRPLGAFEQERLEHGIDVAQAWEEAARGG